MNIRAYDSGRLDLSVVVIVLRGEDSLRRCLDALVAQEGASTIEIIVPYDATHRAIIRLQQRHPNVQFIYVDGERTYAELRSLGIRQAKAGIVAVTEDHCTPRSDWCAQVLQNHQADVAAVGGAVEKEAPDRLLHWALYFADYVRYANPVANGPADHLTDCNVSYKRAALEFIADTWRNEFHEPEVHGALQEEGGQLWLSPNVVVFQQRSISLWDAMKDRYTFGRLFGGRRAESASPAQRWIFSGSATLLPALLVCRISGHVFRKRRYMGTFLRSLPLVVVLSIVWAFGEFLGYVTGRAAASLTPRRRTALSEA